LKNLKNILEIVVGDVSEVAKETTNLIFLDNNFQTIISAIEAGRLVFEMAKYATKLKIR